MIGRSVRCIGCGFLEAELEQCDSSGGGEVVLGTGNPATPGERNPGITLFMPSEPYTKAVRAFACHVDAANLTLEKLNRFGGDCAQKAWLDVAHTLRGCSYFETYQPLLSFREHLDLKLKRRERWWAAGGALAGIVLAATADMVVRLIVG